MRLRAPAIAGATVALAAALVWYLVPGAEPSAVPGNEAAPPQPAPVATLPPGGAMNANASPADRATSGEAFVVQTSAAPTLERAPLPGETPSTPMANLMIDRQRDLPPQLVEGEREFAGEPIDAAWAPGAEANLLAKFAQMPGLALIDLQVECRSTMCRLRLTQPSGAPAVQGGPRPFNLLLDSIGLEPRWMMVIGERGGAMKSVAYLWRDGFVPQNDHPDHAHETD